MSTMTESQFDYLRDLVRRDSSIVLEPGKEYLVESRLAPIARRVGVGSVGDLVEQLVKAPSSDLRGQIIDAMTTNETSFYRDVHPWQALREEIIPALVAARESTRRLTIWCGACSSGQEPYSLAMLLHEHFPTVVRDWQVKIHATDLSETMVARCRSGTFSQLELNRGLPAAALPRWFRREGAEWRIDENLRRMLDVRVANLAQPETLAGVSGLDLVLMRNVLIYFDQVTKSRIFDDVRRRLRPDGVFMLGSSEVSVGANHGFARRQSGKTIYFVPA